MFSIFPGGVQLPKMGVHFTENGSASTASLNILINGKSFKESFFSLATLERSGKERIDIDKRRAANVRYARNQSKQCAKKVPEDQTLFAASNSVVSTISSVGKQCQTKEYFRSVVPFGA